MITFLLSVVSGLAANSIGAGIKSEKYSDIVHRLMQGESLKEDRLRNHHLQKGVMRSYLQAVREIYFLCIQEKKNTAEYNDEFSISIYKNQIKLIDKELKEIDKIKENEVPLVLEDLRYLILPEKTSDFNLAETNKLLIENMPVKYTIDSDLFKDKLRKYIFDLVSKYFAYEIKYNEEVKNIFLIQMSVLQSQQTENIKESSLIYIDKLVERVEETKNEILVELGAVVIEDGERTRESFKLETSKIIDLVTTTHSETKELIEDFISKLSNENQSVTYFLKVTSDGFILDDEEELYDTLFDLREEAKYYKFSTQMYEYMNEVSFEVFLDVEAQLDLELRELDQQKLAGNWTTKDRQRRQQLKSYKTKLNQKKTRMKNNILVFIYTVTHSSSSLTMNLLNFNEKNPNELDLSELSINVTKKIVAQQLNKSEVCSYNSSEHEKVYFVNDFFESFHVILSKKEFKLFNEYDYFLADIKNSNLLEIILPRYIDNLTYCLTGEQNYRTAKNPALMSYWVIKHPCFDRTLNEKMMETFKKTES